MTIMVPWTRINMTHSATGFKKQEHEASPDPLHAKGPARTTLHRGHIAEFSTDTVSAVYTTLRASPIFSASVGRVHFGPSKTVSRMPALGTQKLGPKK